MKRRTFLQTTGLALTGGTLVQAQDPAGALAAKNLLITSAESSLARALAGGLAGQYRIALTGAEDLRTDYPFTGCDFSDPEATAALVGGASAIVHVALPPPGASAAVQIDWRTRGTYNLLQAAARRGVSRVVYLSSLDVMLGYDESYQVTEEWSPRPSQDPGALSHYLGECTCREFAREGKVGVCVLRLGGIVPAEAAGKVPSNPVSLVEPDAVQAVSRALAALFSEQSRLGPWSVFHIVSQPRSARFPATRAGRALGYRPQSAG